MGAAREIGQSTSPARLFTCEREVVAKRIMEMAQHGERDREKLVEDALRFVTANYEEPVA